jgi:multisubunit Na+/H+ antiporter MnhB subunit
MTAVKPPGPGPELPKNVAPGDADFAKLRYTQDLDAWVEEWKAEVAEVVVRTALEASRADADRAEETALVKSLHDAYIATTQSSLDRALTRVNIAIGSIGAVTTIYTGLLALVFAAEPGKGRVLSFAAIIPALFLGLSLLLMTTYAAVFRKSVTVGPLLPTGSGGQLMEARLITFMKWCFASILARSWALHAGIVSLAWGIVTLPLPFVAVSGWQQALIFGAGLVLVALAAGITKYRDREPQAPALPVGLPAG